MGAFLDKPKTEKKTEGGSGCGIHYGTSAMQGWRMEMEDAHLSCIGLSNMPEWSIFGVFDGHAGSKVSSLCAEKLREFVERHLLLVNYDVEKIPAALVDVFLEFDAKLLEWREDADNGATDHSGSTAIVVLISPKHIIWANCGDSRGVLCRGGQMTFATVDHKPYNTEEKARIEKAGGSVMMQRVNGSLAVSRALGDFDYKQARSLLKSNELLKPREQLVSPEPDITCLDRSPEDEFLVLACDGIYDVMSNEEVVKHVRRRLYLRENLADVCCDLIDTCLNKNSRDNMSVVLVAFPNAPKVSQEEIEQDKKRQEEDMEKIKKELQRIVEIASNPLDVEETFVMQQLLETFPDFDVMGKKSVITETLQQLAVEKFKDLACPDDSNMFADSEFHVDEQLLQRHGGVLMGEGAALLDNEVHPMVEPESSSPRAPADDQPPDTT